MSIDRIGLTQNVIGTSPSQSGGVQTAVRPSSTVTPAGDTSTLSKLSSTAPPVDLDLHQILQGVMLRQLPQLSSSSEGKASSATLPTPNFREVSNLQGVPTVNKAFASQSIGSAIQ